MDRDLVTKLHDFLKVNGERCPLCGATMENERHSQDDSECPLKEYIKFLPNGLKRGDWIGIPGYEPYEYYPCIITSIEDVRNCTAYEPSTHQIHHLSAGEFHKFVQPQADKLNEEYKGIRKELNIRNTEDDYVRGSQIKVVINKPSEDISEDASKNIPENISNDVSKDIPKDAFTDVSTDVSNDVTENILENRVEDSSENVSTNMSINPFTNVSTNPSTNPFTNVSENNCNCTDNNDNNNDDNDPFTKCDVRLFKESEGNFMLVIKNKAYQETLFLSEAAVANLLTSQNVNAYSVLEFNDFS